jgi:DNA-binding response OmpR family regulator
MAQKILIVEDEAPLRSLLVKVMSEAGFEVLEADDGQKGLDVALQDHPDLILLDLMMPVKDGMTMLSELRQDEWGKGVQVILLTNVDQEEHKAEAAKYGVDTYLLKWNWKLEDFVGLVKGKLAQ